MEICFKCKKKFKLPKGRTKSFLCGECRKIALNSEFVYPTDKTIPDFNQSHEFMDFDRIIRNIEDGD